VDSTPKVGFHVNHHQSGLIHRSSPVKSPFFLNKTIIFHSKTTIFQGKTTIFTVKPTFFEYV